MSPCPPAAWLGGRRGIAPALRAPPGVPLPPLRQTGRRGIALRGQGRPVGRNPLWGKPRRAHSCLKCLLHRGVLGGDYSKTYCLSNLPLDPPSLLQPLLSPQGVGYTPLLSSQAFTLNMNNQIPRGMRAGPVPGSPLGHLAPFAEPFAVTGGPPGHLGRITEPSAGSARGHFPRRHLAAGGPGRSPPGHHSQAALLGAWSRTAADPRDGKVSTPTSTRRTSASSRPLATRRMYNFCVDNSSS